ncbi:transposase InsO family protein [Arthrobacter sp. UYEF20]
MVPQNKLSDAERAGILAALNSPEFVDLAPMQVYTKLLDQGIYLRSLSTFYRVLEENSQVKERRRLAKHPPRAVPELVATAPGQVFTWDITKLAGPVKGKYFDCYMMVDIHSRFIVGAHVHATESGALAVDMMKGIFGIHGIPQIVHADHAPGCLANDRYRSATSGDGLAPVFREMVPDPQILRRVRGWPPAPTRIGCWPSASHPTRARRWPERGSPVA